MWKRVWVILALTLFLTACADSAETEYPAQVQPEIYTQAQAPVGQMQSRQVSGAARPLTQEDLLAAYDRAVRAISWFELTPMPATSERAEVDGVEYRKVDLRGMENLEDLRLHLNNIFSEELTERLLATGGERPLYREIDGALYVTDGGRARQSDKGDVRVEAVQESEEAYALSVMVDLLDEDRKTVVGLECWSFPYEFEDGRWVFTDFQLVY